MNPKSILLLLSVVLSASSFGQVLNSHNPYVKETLSNLIQFSTQGTIADDQKINFSEVSASFDQYWMGKDHTQKGSGYKPFKRWEYHWANYLDENGMIAPPAHLWRAWQQKIELEAQMNNNPISDWQPIGPAVVSNSATTINGQGRINSVFVDPVDPNILYVGAPAGGIWKSTDNGVNWTALTDHLPQIGVSGIAVDPNNNDIIYISTGDDDAGDSYSIGVMKSTDGGSTWNTTGLQFNNLFQGSNEIYIDPTDSSIIWVATASGLQKSTDAGDTWTNTLNRNIQDFKLKPGDPNTVYAVSPTSVGLTSQFFKSTDGGDSFTSIASIPDSSNRLTIEVTPADPNRVYVLSAGNAFGISYGFQGLYQSTDSGTNFTKTLETDNIFGSSQAWFDMALTVSDTDPNMVFVGVLDIWKSTDGGNDFSQINQWYLRNSRFTHADIHFMRYYNGVLYAGTDGGVYRSSDDGAQFEDLSNTLSIAQLYTISVAKTTSNKIAGGLQDCGGFAYNVDQWNSYHGGDGMGSAVHPLYEDLYYGMIQNGSYLFRNYSGGLGQTEEVAYAPAEGEWVTPLIISKSGKIYAGYDQLYKLNGYNWEQVSNESFNQLVKNIELDNNNNNIIYLSYANQLFKSSDFGETFSLIYTSQSTINAIETHHINSDILWVATTNNVLKSMDGGQSFTNISNGLPSESKRVIKHQPFSPNDAVYLGTSLGVYYLDNTTPQWMAFSENLPNVAVTDLDINSNDNILTASTYGRGVWQTEIPAVNLPDYDIDIHDLSLNPSYLCSDTPALLTVFNNGTQSIQDFDILYAINGGEVQTQSWTGSLASNSSKQIEITLPNNLNDQDNSVDLEVQLNSETLTQNNEISKQFDRFTNQVGVINTLYEFSDDDTEWSTKGSHNLWNIAAPSNEDILSSVSSGTSAYLTFENGNYPNNANEELISPCYDLTALTNPNLRFNLSYSVELNYDYLRLQYSINGGTDWFNLDSFTGYSPLNSYEYDLSGLNDVYNIIFRFVLTSDISLQSEGALIDDFQLTGTLGLELPNTSLFDLYPNPSSGLFQVDFTPSHHAKSILVYDIIGRTLYNNKSITTDSYTIDLSQYPKGIYMAKITVGRKTSLKKIVIQ